MTSPDLDLAIQDIKQDFRRTLLLKREDVITRLGNAFEKIVSNPESICDEIKNSLKEEIIDKIISVRFIERHCPEKWKNVSVCARILCDSTNLENCKTCDKPLKSHFYQFYHNDETDEHYRTGLITSTDEICRYNFLAEYKKVKGGLFGEFERLLSVKKEILCPECYKARETKIVATQLHLVPDSFNAELAHYMSTLPDLSHYPPSRDYLEGYFGLGDDFGYGMQERLNIAFAEENVTFDKNVTFEKVSQQLLDDLQNNFIKDKARRYPNEEELTRWLRQEFGDVVSHCKIFDMRGLDYIYSDVMRRFEIIVHLGISGLWCGFSIPAKE